MGARAGGEGGGRRRGARAGARVGGKAIIVVGVGGGSGLRGADAGMALRPFWCRTCELAEAG